MLSCIPAMRETLKRIIVIFTNVRNISSRPMQSSLEYQPPPPTPITMRSSGRKSSPCNRSLHHIMRFASLRSSINRLLLPIGSLNAPHALRHSSKTHICSDRNAADPSSQPCSRRKRKSHFAEILHVPAGKGGSRAPSCSCW